MKRKLSSFIVSTLCGAGFALTLVASPFPVLLQSGVRAQATPRPIVIFSAVRGMPKIAAHIADAQFNRGYPLILNKIVGNKPLSDRNRAIACAGFVPQPPPDTSCDEYPFAISYQGGAGASIRAVPVIEQQRQGGTITAGTRGLPDRGEFMVLPAP
jgi:Deoxyribonuclease NucA/NucB